MNISWKKVAPVLTIGILILCFPFFYELVNPDHFSGIACIREYPNGRLEKDMGESCYDPELPDALVLTNKK